MKPIRLTQPDHDRRSLALHACVAVLLRRDPGLLDVAIDRLSAWRQTADAGSLPALDAWDRVLRAGLDATLAMALSDTPRAAQLRQSSPLSGLLSPKARWAFLDDWKAREAEAQ